MGSDEFMKRLAAIPAAERARIDMTEATIRILARQISLQGRLSRIADRGDDDEEQAAATKAKVTSKVVRKNAPKRPRP